MGRRKEQNSGDKGLVLRGAIGRVIHQKSADFGIFTLLLEEGQQIATPETAGEEEDFFEEGIGGEQVVVVQAKNCGVLIRGSKVRVQGEWARSNYGWRLEADFLVPDEGPNAGIAAAFLRYRIEGIAEHRAAWLCDRFGQDLPEALASPEKLAEVPGIGIRLAERIATEWAELSPANRAWLELAGYGVTPGAATKLVETFGAQAAEEVKANPWVAVRANGLGFKAADTLAKRFGVAMDKPERARAAVDEAFKQVVKRKGSTRAVKADVLKAIRVLGVGAQAADKALQEAIDAGMVKDLGGGVLSPKNYDFMEKYVALRLLEMATEEVDVEPVLPTLEGIELTDEQKAGVIGLQRKRVGMLVGGPGTGKTTTCRAIKRAFQMQGAEEEDPDGYQSGVPIFGMAPTGRAARQLSSSAELEATTIHRGLGYKWEEGVGTWAFNASNPLPKSMIIVDEMSMVDQELFYRLMAAVRAGSTVLFVGDKDQLPSVGPGAVLRDLLSSGKIPVYQLTRIMRQAAGNPVIRECHRINKGLMPVSGKSDSGMVRVVTANKSGKPVVESEDVREAVMAYARWLKDQGIPLREVQVLCFGKKTEAGVKALNGQLRELWLGNDCPELKFPVGSLVMQVRNDYKIGVMNGTQGSVLDVATDGVRQNGALVQWDGQEDPVWHRSGFRVNKTGKPEGSLSTVDLAFAMSVHKSQGSEWPYVIVSMHPGMGVILLYREVLYTAASRAKVGLVLVGPATAIAKAAQTVRGNDRVTGLRQRLTEGVDRLRGLQPVELHEEEDADEEAE